MKDFEIILPFNSKIIDVTSQKLYDYSFSNYSLVPFQETAGDILKDKIKNFIFDNISFNQLVNNLGKEKNTEFVAKLSDYAKQMLKEGKWEFVIKKDTSNALALLRDRVTGKFQCSIELEQRVMKSLEYGPELIAMQAKLAAITKEIEKMTRLVERIEQGQYNDRYAGFFGARQLFIESMVTSSETVRTNLLTDAIKLNTETIAKLMLAVYQDATAFIDIRVKPTEARRIDNLLQMSIGYLNSSVQLNVALYTALGEKQALMATLSNYKSFINQTLLRKIEGSSKTVAWKLDNARVGSDGLIQKTSVNLEKNITLLVKELKLSYIEGRQNGRIS